MNVFFSLCIPTYKRPELLEQTLKSIFAEKIGPSELEVCISDNSETDETERLLAEKFAGIPNLRYQKSDCVGFLNSIEALKMGSGTFLKLLNDYSVFHPGALRRMIAVAHYCEKEKTLPVVFFSMGAMKNKKTLTRFHNMNDFMANIHYYATWSTSFAIWGTDFERLTADGIEVDSMYPHMSLLYALADREEFVVDDFEYVTNLEPKKKGGYNYLNNFIRIHLTMAREELLEKGWITEKTYRWIAFRALRYVAWEHELVDRDERYEFTFDHPFEIIGGQCGPLGVLTYYLFYWGYSARGIIRKLKG